MHDDGVSGEVGSRQWKEPERPLLGAAVEALGRLGFVGGGPERNFARDGLPRSAAKLAKLTDTLLRTAYGLDEDFSPVVHEIHLNDVTPPRAEPFTREMIEAHLRDHVTHFLRDEDGDFREALERCNTWNRQHRWPKACVMEPAVTWAEIQVIWLNPAACNTSVLVRWMAGKLAAVGWKPQAVSTDNGSEFRSQEVRRVVQVTGAQQRFSRAGPRPTAAWSGCRGPSSMSAGDPQIPRARLPGFLWLPTSALWHEWYL
jgi:hypothetical protein